MATPRPPEWDELLQVKLGFQSNSFKQIYMVWSGDGKVSLLDANFNGSASFNFFKVIW